MKRNVLLVFIGLVTLGFNASLQAATAVTINYGTVDGVGTTTKDSSGAGGALAGGLIGGHDWRWEISYQHRTTGHQDWRLRLGRAR